MIHKLQKPLLILCGILIALSFTEFTLRLGRHIYQERARIDHSVARTAKGFPVRKIMFVGDSWTFGLEAKPGYSYPAQLQRILDKQAPGKFRIYNEGIPGFTSSKLLKKLPTLMATHTPDIVIILIGMNDLNNPDPTELAETPANSSQPCYYRLRDSIKALRICKVMTTAISMHEGPKQSKKILNIEKRVVHPPIDAISISYCNKGNELRKIGKQEISIKYFKKAISIDPNNEDAYLFLANSYQDLGNFEQSITWCENLLKHNWFTDWRGALYQLLFLLYAHYETPRDKIKKLMHDIPSDGIFLNPGNPYLRNKEQIGTILKHNLEEMILLLKLNKSLPILQIYPKDHDDFEYLKRKLSGQYNIPIVDHENFRNLKDDKNYWGNTHPNENGYYLMAQNIDEILTTHFDLPRD